MYQSTRTLTKWYSGAAFGTAAYALTTIIVWILERFVAVDVPADVASAITTLITLIATLAAVWITPIQAGEIERVPTEPVVFGNGGTVVAPTPVNQAFLDVVDESRSQVPR